jgi:predicted ABC-type ATPase
VIETTLSGKYLVKYITQAKKLDFHISLIYLFLESPDTNITRVRNRVLNGGHNVPQNDIIRRFYRSKEMFFNIYKDLSDNWNIYYNSNESFEKIASNNKILDHEKYNKFLGDTQCKN